MSGGVRSMLIPPTVAVVELPLVSVAVPITDWPAPSVVRSWSASHEARNRSVHTKWTVTAVLFHPAPFGTGLAAPTMVGAVVSTIVARTVAERELPAASVAVHVTVVVP